MHMHILTSEQRLLKGAGFTSRYRHLQTFVKHYA